MTATGSFYTRLTVFCRFYLQPKRIPRPIVKKAKKAKDKGEEEATKEPDEKETEKSENEPGGTKEHKQKDEDTAKDNDDDDDDDDVAYRTPNVVNMPVGEQKPLIRQDTVGSRGVPGASPPGQESSRSAKNEENEKTLGREKAKGPLFLFRFSFIW